MIAIDALPLPAAAQQQLRRWQGEVDAVADYAARVARGKRAFKQRNHAGNSTFWQVRQTLDIMCSGARRCAYCEDSYADEVEHIWPKDLYPGSVFEWANYLYVCGPCNGPKGSKHAVFPPNTNSPQVVSRAPGQPIVPPIEGDPVFLNPRAEDPLDFLILDLSGTFLFMPFASPGTREFERAQYTIEVLRLNARDALVKARRVAYSGYQARIVAYADMRKRGYREDELQRAKEELLTSHHRTVWREMQRQAQWTPELGRLFDRVPEALDW